MACCKGDNNAVCDCASVARCSCGARPAQKCTCEKASTENGPVADPCACGKRPANSCTCKDSEGKILDGETDFTNMK